MDIVKLLTPAYRIITTVYCGTTHYTVNPFIFQRCLAPPSDGFDFEKLEILRMIVDGLIRSANGDTELLSGSDLFSLADHQLQTEALEVAIALEALDLIYMWTRIYEDPDGELYDKLLDYDASFVVWSVATPRDSFHPNLRKQQSIFEKWFHENQHRIEYELATRLSRLCSEIDETFDDIEQAPIDSESDYTIVIKSTNGQSHTLRRWGDKLTIKNDEVEVTVNTETVEAILDFR